MPLDLRRAFAPIDEDGEYVPRMVALRRAQASGIYAIIDERSMDVLYVGESHSGRLFETLTRHFRSWSIATGFDRQGRRAGGTQYDRERVLVATSVTHDDEAQDAQVRAIARLDPEDNVNLFPDEVDAPF